MADTEKITINMNVVDLGKIDLLVDQGFYSSRTDLIRTAVREKLAEHEQVVTEIITRQTFGLGVSGETKKSLEELRQKGEMRSVHVVGAFIITNDVSPELALATIKSVKVFGVFKASQAVKNALAERIK